MIDADFSETSNKIVTAIDLIQSACSASLGKIVVFSSFQSVVDRLAAMLTDIGIVHRTISGNVSPKRRWPAIEEFQNGSLVQVMLITLKTGGEALTLTAANRVVFTDLWWTAAANAQAISRVRRIGQTREVIVQMLVAKGTIDEYILSVAKRKAHITDVYNEALKFTGVRTEEVKQIEIMEQGVLL